MKRIVLGIVLTALLLLPRSTAVQAVEPGSKDDPIITRSYLETLYAWQITNLSDGQTVSLDMGVEFVLRRGTAVVVGAGAEGLIDLTAGREMKDGEKILPHHLMLSPASDRRGLRAISGVVLLTRGLSR